MQFSANGLLTNNINFQKQNVNRQKDNFLAIRIRFIELSSYLKIAVLSKEITIYQCGLCCAEFSSKPHLQQHGLEAHNDEETEWSNMSGKFGWKQNGWSVQCKHVW